MYLQATLYSPKDPQTNAEVVRWNGAVRLLIERGGMIGAWDISPPELVYTGSGTAAVGEPWGLDEVPTGDFLLVSGGENNRGMLNIEQCMLLFAEASYPDPDSWTSCLDPIFDTGDLLGNGSWQSDVEVIHAVVEKKNPNVYRTNVTDGVSTKLIDDAALPDAGM